MELKLTTLQTVLQLLGTLAWPAAVVALGILFRRALSTTLSRALRSQVVLQREELDRTAFLSSELSSRLERIEGERSIDRELLRSLRQDMQFAAAESRDLAVEAGTTGGLTIGGTAANSPPPTGDHLTLTEALRVVVPEYEHALNTPLATVQIAIKELDKHLQTRGQDRDDPFIDALRGQVENASLSLESIYDILHSGAGMLPGTAASFR